MPNKLSDSDIQSAATSLGVPRAAIIAVCTVESKGSGFLPAGHPVILFERHVMYAQVKAKLGAAAADRFAGQYPDVINPKGGGYGTVSEQPSRLERAANLIDRECALESASWGLFQIMGYHWKNLGYPSLQDFINRMFASEGNQLDAFVRFVKADSGLLAALKRRDFTAFARGYNGPNYKSNAYDTKLADAFDRAAGGVA